MERSFPSKDAESISGCDFMPVSSNARIYLGSQLRIYYSQLVEIAMPDRLQALVDRLSHRLDEITGEELASRMFERTGD